jgi:hypothetical protein
VALAQPRKASRLELAFRVAIATALLACAGLAWWSLQMRLLPLEQQSRNLAARVTRLSDEVDAYQRKWNKADIDQIRSEYTQVHTQLFADGAELKAWRDRLDQAAGLQALNLNVLLGKPSVQSTQNVQLALLTANVAIELRPRPVQTESPYERLLRFCEQLAEEGKRADLAEMTITGGTNSITHAVLVFNLWAGEETPEPAAPEAN